MFYENNASSEFSFEGGLSASSAESNARHIINRLRLEFRTASQRQLEEALAAATSSETAHLPEKILQLARASLSQLLTPSLERTIEEAESTGSEPPFRAESKSDGLSASPAS